jgi:biotin transport system substrate-specific component
VSALIAASAWIAIPVGAVPVTFQVFFVVLAALLLPPAWAAASMGAYLALGAIGLPVFSGGQGGLGVLAGPTGGYLFGFLAGAFLGSLVRRPLAGRAPAVAADAVAAVTVVAVVYVFGVAQLAVVANLSTLQAVAAGVVPFIGADALKAAAAVAAASAIRRARGY